MSIISTVGSDCVSCCTLMHAGLQWHCEFRGVGASFKFRKHGRPALGKHAWNMSLKGALVWPLFSVFWWFSLSLWACLVASKKFQRQPLLRAE